MARRTGRRILLTGASGFVGRHLHPALVAAGHDVRCATRHPERHRETQPDREWVKVDLDEPATLPPALDGCTDAYFLVHQIAAPGYQEREEQSALRFAEAAATAGVRRLVYLGGVEPRGRTSVHLASRLATGRILRRGAVPTVELRAGMIVGAGSASWRIVRDLAARLPAMVLPTWLRSHSEPVCIDDVVVALTGALDVPLEGSAAWDIPGPETLSIREMLERTATLMGRRPLLVSVPFVSPRLSTYWLAAVARGDRYLAGQLVEGLRCGDLVAGPHRFWPEIGHDALVPFVEAARRTLDAEAASVSRAGRVAERIAGALSRRVRSGA